MELLQSIGSISNPVLDAVFEGITMLGEQVVLAGVFCLVYWCLSKELGVYLLIGLCTTVCTNGIVKDIVKAPRPFWEPGVIAKRIETATGYSFPSGHSQSAATVWASVALWVRRLWVGILMAVIILGIGFSRLYLGVHYLQDVVCGILLGLFVAVGVLFVMRRLTTGFMLIVLGILAIVCLFVGESKDTFAGVGLVLGLMPGLWLEMTQVRFSPPAGFWQGFIRLVTGGIIIGVLYLLPKLIFPSGHLRDVIGNAVIAFVGVGGFPWLFTRLEKGGQSKRRRYQL